MNKHAAYNAYAQNNLRVESSAKLVEMMYEGILKFSSLAKKSIAENDTEKRVYWINRASDIFVELINSIDFERGGDIAHYLNGLYAHQVQLLSEANVKNDATKIDTVLHVVKELLEAWRETAVQELAEANR